MNKLLSTFLLAFILINPWLMMEMLGEENQNQETIISGENRRD
jgi:hypothetical protein